VPGSKAAPDLLAVTSTAHAIERRWAAAAEHAADRLAAGTDNPTRCALASALVKVARLMPPMRPVNEPISTLLDGGEIASRVEQLLDDRMLAPMARDHATGRLMLLAGLTVAVVLGYTPLLQIVHNATEVLVNTLP
jgi:hypothetical protein